MPKHVRPPAARRKALERTAKKRGCATVLQDLTRKRESVGKRARSAKTEAARHRANLEAQKVMRDLKWVRGRAWCK